MEAPDEQLLTDAYWQSEEIDLRLNPFVQFDREGLGAFLESCPEARGHVIFSTSGSTGKPKLVCLSRTALLASAEAVNAHLQVTGSDRWLCPLPAFHVGGYSIWTRARRAGIPVREFAERWNPERFVALCEKDEVTLTSLVPTQVFDLVRNNLPCPETLRAVLVGGGSLSSELSRKARNLGWPVLRTYGMTEAASQVATESGGIGHNSDDASLPILPHWQVATTRTGRLKIRGPALFTGYVEPNETSWTFSPAAGADGWFVTEDTGEIHDGRLEIFGRHNRTVKILGELVNVDRLESLLHRIRPEAASVTTLVTVPDERTGHLLVLAAEKHVPASELVETFNDKVAPFERIREIRTIEKLPRSPLGKIQRNQLTKLCHPELAEG